MASFHPRIERGITRANPISLTRALVGACVCIQNLVLDLYVPCASMVSGAVTMPVGMASDSEKSVTSRIFLAREIFLLEVPPIFSVPPDP